MNSPAVLWELDGRGVATVTLNRPAVNNAYDAELIAGLHATLDALADASSLRVVVLRGAGRHFQAGADLAWLNEVARSSHADNVAGLDARGDTDAHLAEIRHR